MDSEKEIILKNKYRIIKQIGRGAMGHVYLAKSLDNDREFAVKKLEISCETGLNENMAKEIFSKEVKFLSRFNHRGLPRFQEIFVENNSHYLIMEYIKGKTLEEIINSGERVEERRAIKWIIEIGEILSYLHNSFEAPIVYRDLKPANIIITPEGMPRLIDFGISRYYNPDKNTDTFRLGSPGYAAPEQYKGRGQSGPQTDIFSMGVILYELLTGYDPTVTPFKFPPMKTLNPSLSDDLVKIVTRAVELRALKRYISVLEFKEDLEKYISPPSTDLKVIPQSRIVLRKTSVRFFELFTARDIVPFIYFILVSLIYSVTIIMAGGLDFSIIIIPLMFIAIIVRSIFYSNLLVTKLNLYFNGMFLINSKDLISGDTPLHSAIKTGDENFASLLISMGADIYIRNNVGESPLEMALDKGYRRTVFLLIEAGADMCIRGKKNLLIEVIKKEWDDVALMLLEREVDVSIKDKGGNTPLHLAVNFLLRNLVSHLIKRGFDININNNMGDTPLHTGISKDEGISMLLVDSGADVNVVNSDGNTPLHLAIKKEFTSLIKLLIKNGARVNVGNKQGDSPLHIAIERGDREIIDLLIAGKADMECKNGKAMTPLQVAAEKGKKEIVELFIKKEANRYVKNKNGESLLILAIKNNHRDVVELLVKNEVSPDPACSEDRLILHTLIQKEWSDIAELLISKGADTNSPDKQGRTPLYPAIEKNSFHLIESLLSHGSDINVKDIYKSTPLHLAAENNRYEITELLILKGADLNLKDRMDRTPLHIAVEKNNMDILNCLIKGGAHRGIKDRYGRTPLEMANFKGYKEISEVLSHEKS